MYISNRTFMTLKTFAERLGVDEDVIRRRHRHGAIAAKRCRGDYRITLKELRRFACSHDCWTLVHPRDIIDPDVRQAALDAWRAAGCPRCYTTSDLTQHYAATQSTIKGWRSRGWLEGHWLFQGGAESRRGVYWLIWAGDLPDPPVRKPSPHGQTFIKKAAAHRAPVVDAVLSRGGPPGKGTSFWPQIAAELGSPIATCRTRWRKAVAYGEVPQATAAD